MVISFFRDVYRKAAAIVAYIHDRLILATENQLLRMATHTFIRPVQDEDEVWAAASGREVGFEKLSLSTNSFSTGLGKKLIIAEIVRELGALGALIFFEAFFRDWADINQLYYQAKHVPHVLYYRILLYLAVLRRRSGLAPTESLSMYNIATGYFKLAWA